MRKSTSVCYNIKPELESRKIFESQVHDVKEIRSQKPVVGDKLKIVDKNTKNIGYK